MKSLLAKTLLALTLVSAVSCSGTPGPVAVHPVNGQVFYGEQPAAGVKVYFFPTSAPQMPQIPANPHGITGPDGRFTLTTYKDSDGAAEGGYSVILLWQPATKPNEESCNEEKLLGWYDAAHTKLTAHIKTGDNNLAPIRLPIRSTPPLASRGVPGRN